MKIASIRRITFIFYSESLFEFGGLTRELTYSVSAHTSLHLHSYSKGERIKGGADLDRIYHHGHGTYIPGYGYHHGHGTYVPGYGYHHGQGTYAPGYGYQHGHSTYAPGYGYHHGQGGYSPWYGGYHHGHGGFYG